MFPRRCSTWRLGGWLGLLALCGAVCFGRLALAEAGDEGPAEPKPPTARKKAPARDVLARAKAATALVEINGLGLGTAFCVRSNRLFVTNAHVVASIHPGDSLRLILASGTKTERALAARLVAVSEFSDLALLRAESSEKLVALPLGDDGKLQETTPVTALGYPFGRMLSRQHGNPAVSVNQGQVSALRAQSDGSLERIQMDVVLNPGNSGGPILNASGQVVGIAVEIIYGSGISFAVPVSRLREFMVAPALLMKCPSQDYFSSQPPLMEIELEQFGTKRAELVVEGRFPGATEPDKVFTAEPRDGHLVIQPPTFTPAAKTRLRLMALSPAARRVFDVEDRTIKLGKREFHLAELRRIEPRAAMSLVTTLAGERFAGNLTGLEVLPWPKNSPQPTAFTQIEVEAYDVDVGRFRYHLSVLDGEEEVAHLSGRLELTGMPSRVDPAVGQDTLAYWRFEDGQPGRPVGIEPRFQIVRDSSGNGNHLRAFGPANAPAFSHVVPSETIPQSGMANHVALDNSEAPPPGTPTRDLYQVPWMGPGLDLQQQRLKDWTVEASVLFTNFNAHPVQTFVSNAGSNYPRGEPKCYNVLMCSAGGKLNVLAHTELGDAREIFYQQPIQHSTWYHVAMVSNHKTLRFYLSHTDSSGYKLVGETAFDGGLYFTGNSWFVGRGGWDNQPADQFIGQIDEVRITAAALRPEELLFAPRKGSK